MLIPILANEFILEQTTRTFHWNVEGALFLPLHELFGKQYEELSEFIDDLAETIRQNDEEAPDHEEMMKEATLPTTPAMNADEMVQELYKLHELMKRSLTEELKKSVGSEDLDEASRNLLINLLAWHKKQCWKLGMHLPKNKQPIDLESELQNLQGANPVTPSEDADVRNESAAEQQLPGEESDTGGSSATVGSESSGESAGGYKQ